MIEPCSTEIPEEFLHWRWAYFTSEANSEMSDTENGTNRLQPWAKRAQHFPTNHSAHENKSQDEQLTSLILHS